MYYLTLGILVVCALVAWALFSATRDWHYGLEAVGFTLVTVSKYFAPQ